MNLRHRHSLESMDRVNRAIQRTHDLNQMMSDVLDAVLDIFNCDRAYLLYPCDPLADTWHIPMERTRPNHPGLLAQGGAMPMDEEIAEKLRIFLQADGPVMFNPSAPPRFVKLAQRFDIQSCLGIALHPKLDKPWQFGIHQCSHPRVWTQDEALLLQRIGRRLADGLTSLLAFRKLQVSEREFRTLAENAPINIARYDNQGRLLYLNPQLERLLQTSSAEILGKRPDERPAKGSLHGYCQAIDYVAATGKEVSFELQWPASGEQETHQIQMVAERDKNGAITGVLAMGQDITDRKEIERQLREFSVHLFTVREEEKARLARELHDELGSTLAAAKIRLTVLANALSVDEKTSSLSGRVEPIMEILDGVIEFSRRIISDLRPTVLDNFGLLAAIKWQATQFQKHAGIECRVDCIPGNTECQATCRSGAHNSCDEKLNETLSTNLFRIVQEALNNAARHSHASRVIIEFKPGDSGIVLSISDNGCGLPKGHTVAPTSYGIRGMRERVAQLGGKIEFYSPPGGGLGVTVQAPYQ